MDALHSDFAEKLETQILGLLRATQSINKAKQNIFLEVNLRSIPECSVESVRSHSSERVDRGSPGEYLEMGHLGSQMCP